MAFRCGHFINEKLARVCVEYINRELVIPFDGKVVPSDRDGEYRLEFEGLEQYTTTRDKVMNAVNDFKAGWVAAMAEVATSVVTPQKRLKK